MEFNINKRIMSSKIPTTNKKIYPRSQSTGNIRVSTVTPRRTLTFNLSHNQSIFNPNNKNSIKSCLKKPKYNQISPLDEKEILLDFEMKPKLNEIVPAQFVNNLITDIDTNEYKNKLLDRLNKIEHSLLLMREDKALSEYDKKMANSIGQYDNVFRLMKKDDLGNQLARYNLGFKHLRKRSVERLINNRSHYVKVRLI